MALKKRGLGPDQIQYNQSRLQSRLHTTLVQITRITPSEYTLNILYWEYFHCSGFLSNLRLPSKTEFSRKMFTILNIVLAIQDFWATLRLPWNFSLYSKYFLHSGFLSNLRLPWIRCIEYIFFTLTCGEVRDWGGTVSFTAKFASVWIEWSSINSPLNWLLAEWLLPMLSIPYHNLLHT